MSKYRFKTKEEFIRDKLWDEERGCPIYWNTERGMNKYLGTDVPDMFNEYCDKNTSFTYGGCNFKSNEYVLKEQQKYFDDLSQHNQPQSQQSPFIPHFQTAFIPQGAQSQPLPVAILN